MADTRCWNCGLKQPAHQSADGLRFCNYECVVAYRDWLNRVKSKSLTTQRS